MTDNVRTGVTEEVVTTVIVVIMVVMMVIKVMVMIWRIVMVRAQRMMTVSEVVMT